MARRIDCSDRMLCMYVVGGIVKEMYLTTKSGDGYLIDSLLPDNYNDEWEFLADANFVSSGGASDISSSFIFPSSGGGLQTVTGILCSAGTGGSVSVYDSSVVDSCGNKKPLYDFVTSMSVYKVTKWSTPNPRNDCTHEQEGELLLDGGIRFLVTDTHFNGVTDIKYDGWVFVNVQVSGETQVIKLSFDMPTVEKYYDGYPFWGNTDTGYFDDNRGFPSQIDVYDEDGISRGKASLQWYTYSSSEFRQKAGELCPCTGKDVGNYVFEVIVIYDPKSEDTIGYYEDVEDWENAEISFPTSMHFTASIIPRPITFEVSSPVIEDKDYDGFPISYDLSLAVTIGGQGFASYDYNGVWLQEGADFDVQYQEDPTFVKDVIDGDYHLTYSLSEGNITPWVPSVEHPERGDTNLALNYEVTIISPKQASAKISPKTIYPTPQPTDITRPYDCTEQQLLTSSDFDLAGVVSGDEGKVSLYVSRQSYGETIKDVKEGGYRVTYYYSISGIESHNYKLGRESDTITITIEPIELNWYFNPAFGIDYEEKDYDGIPLHVTEPSIRITNAASCDVGKIRFVPTVTCDPDPFMKDVGTYRASVTYEIEVDEGVKLTNYTYTLPESETVTGTITKKTISPSELVPLIKTYNCVPLDLPYGLADGPYLVGKAAGDDVSLKTTSSSDGSNIIDAGTYTVRFTYSLEGEDKGNYNLDPTSATLDITIKKRCPGIVVSPDLSIDYEEKPYDGSPLIVTEPIVSLTNLAECDEGKISIVPAVTYSPRQFIKDVGPYSATVTYRIVTKDGARSSNYDWEGELDGCAPLPSSSTVTGEIVCKDEGVSLSGYAAFYLDGQQISGNQICQYFEEGVPFDSITTITDQNPTIPDSGFAVDVRGYSLSGIVEGDEVDFSITASLEERTEDGVDYLFLVISVDIDSPNYCVEVGRESRLCVYQPVVEPPEPVEPTPTPVDPIIPITPTDPINPTDPSYPYTPADPQYCVYVCPKIWGWKNDKNWDGKEKHYSEIVYDEYARPKKLIVRCYIPDYDSELYPYLNDSIRVNLVAIRRNAEQWGTHGNLNSLFSIVKSNRTYTFDSAFISYPGDVVGRTYSSGVTFKYSPSSITFDWCEIEVAVNLSENRLQDEYGVYYWEVEIPVKEDWTGQQRYSSIEHHGGIASDIPYDFMIWATKPTRATADYCSASQLNFYSFPALTSLPYIPKVTEGVFLVEVPCDETTSDQYGEDYRGSDYWNYSAHTLENAIYFANFYGEQNPEAAPPFICFSSAFSNNPVVSKNMEYGIRYATIIDATKPYKFDRRTLVVDNDTKQWSGVVIDGGMRDDDGNIVGSNPSSFMFVVDTVEGIYTPEELHEIDYLPSVSISGVTFKNREKGLEARTPISLDRCTFDGFTMCGANLRNSYSGTFSYVDETTHERVEVTYAGGSSFVSRCTFKNNGITRKDENGEISGIGWALRVGLRDCVIENCLFVNNNIAVDRPGSFVPIYSSTIIAPTEELSDSSVSAYNYPTKNNSNHFNRGEASYAYGNMFNCFVAGYPFREDWNPKVNPSAYNVILKRVSELPTDEPVVDEELGDEEVLTEEEQQQLEEAFEDVEVIETLTFNDVFGEGNEFNNELYDIDSVPVSSFVYSNLTPRSTNELYTLIDKGDNSRVSWSYDLNNNPRIYNEIVDIGCYEYLPYSALPSFNINVTDLVVEYDGTDHFILTPDVSGDITLYVLPSDYDESFDWDNVKDAGQIDEFFGAATNEIYYNIPTVRHVAIAPTENQEGNSEYKWSQKHKVVLSIAGYQAWYGEISAVVTPRPLYLTNLTVTYESTGN